MMAIQSSSMQKNLLYKFVIRQLHDDGFTKISQDLMDASNLSFDTNLKPNFLSELVNRIHENNINSDINGALMNDENLTGSKISSQNGSVSYFSKYQTKFITTHKDECRVGVFSRDGTLAATGSADMSIKLLDVSKMHYHSQAKSAGEQGDDYLALKPVLRTFYDHLAPINDLDFHPNATLLASCSKDNSIKFFDHEKLFIKRAYKQVVEPQNIRSIQFHPSGDYLISGGDNPYVRIFNITTFQAYISKDVENQHTMPINQVRYNNDGRQYATCSKDGSIKYWDGISNSCIRTIANAHKGEQVSSVEFSKDSKYLLTGGRDSTAKIWDVSTGIEVFSFTGCTQKNYRLQTAYARDDKHVLSSDEINSTIVAQDHRTGEKICEFEGHNKVVKWIAVSPSEQAFLSCSADSRARFWSEDI